MQDASFELPHRLSAAHLKTLHLNRQSACQLRWPIRNRQFAWEDV